MNSKKMALTTVFLWFFIGGIGHFVAPDFFLKIVPPSLPLRIQAVYISGFFELVGAIGLLHPRYRKWACVGLFVLTIVVTPANAYMWLNPQLFSSIPEWLLGLRMILQGLLLLTIWWASTPESEKR